MPKKSSKGLPPGHAISELCLFGVEMCLSVREVGRHGGKGGGVEWVCGG